MVLIIFNLIKTNNMIYTIKIYGTHKEKENSNQYFDVLVEATGISDALKKLNTNEELKDYKLDINAINKIDTTGLKTILIP
jgi:hypothetical protein